MKELARRGATLILVLGSPTSSNAQRLVEVARAAGAEAALIDGESELPDELLATHGYGEVEEVTVAREDVHFRLPREVARS